MAATEPRHWPTREHRDLFETVASLRTKEEAQSFLRDLCTRAELDAMAHRWQVARLLDEGLPYLEVARRAHASTTTVTRVAQWLRRGEGGYRLALAAAATILRIAVPSKGRLRDPAIALLEDAGLGPETPGDRALAFPCRNAPVEALLVRADDIPEYVQDGVVDCGVTGLDIVRERGANVTELQRLGFGACTLEAAVPEESTFASPEDLTGARIATSFPRLAQDLLPVSIALVDVHGSVELAPRLGLADAIVDLVSSGSTLRTNGLRSIGVLLESEAVLIGPAEPCAEAVQLAGVFRSVVDARGMRYLMLNAPEDAIEAICALVPGSRAPSVLPLSEPGMVAVHSLVPAADIWRLLPELEDAGASSILIVPVERMLG